MITMLGAWCIIFNFFFADRELDVVFDDHEFSWPVGVVVNSLQTKGLFVSPQNAANRKS